MTLFLPEMVFLYSNKLSNIDYLIERRALHVARFSLLAKKCQPNSFARLSSIIAF